MMGARESVKKRLLSRTITKCIVLSLYSYEREIYVRSRARKWKEVTSRCLTCASSKSTYMYFLVVRI